MPKLALQDFGFCRLCARPCPASIRTLTLLSPNSIGIVRPSDSAPCCLGASIVSEQYRIAVRVRKNVLEKSSSIGSMLLDYPLCDVETSSRQFAIR